MNTPHGNIEYRYYEIPSDTYVLPLLGQHWIIHHTSGVDPEHFHNYLEVGYCYYATGEMVLPAQHYALAADCVCIVPENQVHCTACAPGSKSHWEYLYIDVEAFLHAQYPERPDFVLNVCTTINRSALFLYKKEGKALGMLVRELLDECRQKRLHYQEVLCGLLHAFLIRLYRLQASEGKRLFLEKGTKKSVDHAVHYITAHYSRPIRIAELADACFMSETNFRRNFHRAMNMSPLAYINLVRVEMSCKMLRTTTLPMKDVAVKNGFATISSFNRIFKALTGVSPSQWKKATAYHERKLQKQNVIPLPGCL